MEAPYKYWAFITTSHADNAACDCAFQGARDLTRIPPRLAGREGRFGPVPARVYPSFATATSSAGSAELSASLVEAR
jgi:hypothetical protein